MSLFRSTMLYDHLGEFWGQVNALKAQEQDPARRAS